MANRFTLLLGAYALCACLWSAGAASAQLHRASDPVATPAGTLVLQDDAAAIDVNPAALGLMHSWGLSYRHAQLDERGGWLGQGDALSFGTPLLFGVSLGATVQSIRPGSRAARVATAKDPVDRAMWGLSLAYAPSKRSSFGVTGRGFTSSDPSLDGLTTWDVGLAWHAADWLGVSITGRDLWVSRKGFGTTDFALPASLLTGIQVRPFGNSELTLALDAAVDGRERVGGRLGVGVRVPYLGYASTVIELERIGRRDDVYRVLAELDVSFERATLGAGVIAGDGFGGGPGVYAVARLEGQARQGVSPPPAVLDVELSGSSERGILRTLLTLEAAVRDERVAGVLLRPRGGSLGTAYAQELRLVIRSLRAAGKRVLCHLEDASGSQYYACAGADHVLIDPAGSIRLLGSASEVVLFGDTLRKVGLHADFIRIGDYKSAPEQFTERRLSEAGRKDLTQLFADIHARVVQDLAGDRHVEPEDVTAVMDRGPHLTPQALADKLVSGVADDVVVREGVDPALQDRPVVSALPARARSDWYAGPRIGVAVIDGTLIDGESMDIPVIGLHMTGGRTAAAAIDALASDPLVRAIVLRVDSPGGAVLASDQIWRAVRRARAQKPVVVSLGAVAASGGYYVASAGDEIWADPATLLGSIGIFYGKVDVVELAEKLGVGIEVFKIGKRAGADSLYRPFTQDERQALMERLSVYYQMFLQRVATGRGMSTARVDELGQGRIYSGDRALPLGLVDHLGGFASALQRARQLAHIGDSAETVVLPKRPQGVLDYVFGELSGGADSLPVQPAAAAWIPAPLRAALSQAAALQQLGAQTPLALLPYEVEL